MSYPMEPRVVPPEEAVFYPLTPEQLKKIRKKSLAYVIGAMIFAVLWGAFGFMMINGGLSGMSFVMKIVFLGVPVLIILGLLWNVYKKPAGGRYGTAYYYRVIANTHTDSDGNTTTTYDYYVSVLFEDTNEVVPDVHVSKYTTFQGDAIPDGAKVFLVKTGRNSFAVYNAD